ncbi:MAG TPA: hydroxymethylglutaryl-CoA synthase [Gammaproteobacteria bacterium]|nr:hydroxymethylglutaryl-CoA synthase [Gammaproteobacteria bacterium]
MQVTHQDFGISAFGLAIPQYALPLTEFARLRNVDAAQYTQTLGCEFMALCGPNDNVVSLAVRAAKRALANWGGSTDQIGMVVVASESAIDMSRPLSSWVMSELGLQGQIRAYEVKHACYSGTVAVRQALEWKLSGNSQGKAALVIASDVALYAEHHSGEPTQGAGAIAMIIDEPTIAAISPHSYCWSEPQFDFWRPIGTPYPEVNGRLSLVCYITAVLQCFKQLAPQTSLGQYLDEFKHMCLHVPFPKMVFKAFKRLGEHCGWDADQILQQYQTKVFTTMQWNQQIGNAYTASLWFSVANALTRLQAKEQLLAFSYGSGCGSELLTLQCTTPQATSTWRQELENDLANRTIVDAKFYQNLRDNMS